MNTEQFVEKALVAHGSGYDYSLVNYVATNASVIIICPVHGKFNQRPHNHLRGSGCSLCARAAKNKTTELFVQQAREVHGDKYDYTSTTYDKNYKKVSILCPTHGEFLQTPNNHLSGYGCAECAGVARKTTERFIQQAREAHGDKYDYSLVAYTQDKVKVVIRCPKHGNFEQRPNNHIHSRAGCPTCAHEDISANMRVGTETFVKRAVQIHGDKYDYSKVVYVDGDTPVSIICKQHGVFNQAPGNHTHNKQGCPKCGNWISEPETKWLDQHDVPDTPNTRQVTIKIGNKRYKVDGYVPETNTVYEFWGDYWHGNPRKFEPSQLNVQTNKTFGELYEQTLSKRQAILDAGYNLVEIWESDYVK